MDQDRYLEGLRIALAAISDAATRLGRAVYLPTNRFEAECEEVPVFESQAREYQACYPAVDVWAQLLEMRAWSIANPSKRKTRRGMAAFVNGWLSREQDRPPRTAASNRPKQSTIITLADVDDAGARRVTH